MKCSLFAGVVLLGVIGVVPPAHADLIVEGSLGKGAELGSRGAGASTNFMIAPGFAFSFLRAELGFVWNRTEARQDSSNLELRPMLVVAPPLLPLYGRAIVIVPRPGNAPTQIALGAAAGLELELGALALFAEVGALLGTGASKGRWTVEGRVGAGVTF